MNIIIKQYNRNLDQKIEVLGNFASQKNASEGNTSQLFYNMMRNIRQGLRQGSPSKIYLTPTFNCLIAERTYIGPTCIPNCWEYSYNYKIPKSTEH